MTRDAVQIRESLLTDYLDRYPAEVAAEVESFPLDAVVDLFDRQTPERSGELLRRMRAEVGADVLQAMSDDGFGRVAPAMDAARVAQLLTHLSPESRQRRMDRLDPALATELRELMTYPPESAGALMEPVVATLRPDTTVHDALERLRGAKNKAIFQVLVVDGEGRLTAAVPLHELALAPPDAQLETLFRGPPPSVAGLSSQSEVVELLEKYRLPSLPVVDFDGRLIGVIRHDGLVRAAEKEALADMQQMVGASKSERALSPISFAVKKRLPWLQINLGTAFLAAFVVGLFEDTIAQFTALAVLLPVAAGQSGNTGAQALAVTMRGLALREIRVRHWFRVASKELTVGFVNGIAVAVVTAAAVFVWSRSAGLAAVIGVAMVLSMVIAGAAGAMVPIVLTVFRQDPAQASSIILTTVTDIAGFLSFLGLATLARGIL